MEQTKKTCGRANGRLQYGHNCNYQTVMLVDHTASLPLKRAMACVSVAH